MPETLANRGSRIDQPACFFRKNQGLAPVLEGYVLPRPAEDIFVVADGDDICVRKTCQNGLRSRVFCNPLLNIDMAERFSE